MSLALVQGYPSSSEEEAEAEVEEGQNGLHYHNSSDDDDDDGVEHKVASSPVYESSRPTYSNTSALPSTSDAFTEKDPLNSDQFLASLDQWYEEEQQQQFSDSSLLVPQQQVEPNNSCEEQQQQQGEQQLCGGFDMTVYLDIDLDTPYLQSDEFNGFDQDQPEALYPDVL